MVGAERLIALPHQTTHRPGVASSSPDELKDSACLWIIYGANDEEVAIPLKAGQRMVHSGTEA